jgi:hypothetical protein
MDTKSLRKVHQRRFTQVVTHTVNGKEVRTRIKNANYIPFRKWIRMSSGSKLTGKAKEIFDM